MKTEIPNSSDRAARLQRESEDAEAVAALRQLTTRNIPAAISSFALALLFVWKGYMDGYTVEIGGKDVFVVKGLINLVASVSLACAAIGRLWVSPRDKLLARIVDDYLKKNADDARMRFMDAHVAQRSFITNPPDIPENKVGAKSDATLL